MAEYKLKPLTQRYYRDTILMEEMKKGTQARIGSEVDIWYMCSYMQGERCIVVDTNAEERVPFRFRLGFVDIIEGWDFAICGMFVGGRRRITIPSSFGRGTSAAPWNRGRKFLPRGSEDLIIDVEVYHIVG